MNLKTLNEKQIELLPFRESRVAYSVREKTFYAPYDHYYNADTNPYKICEYILNNNIGKSFNLAFHYYCKLVKKYDQHIFLEKFQDKNHWKYNPWSLDENNNIVFINWREPKKYYFYSEDYKTELRHKITGHAKKEFNPKYSYKYHERYKHKYRTEKIEYYNYKNRYKAQDSDFEPIVVSGFEMKFESKNDSRFKKLNAEHQSKLRKRQREADRLKKQIEYSFLSKTEIELKKEKQLNLQKIISHGFDPELSFRTNKIYNSDL